MTAARLHSRLRVCALLVAVLSLVAPLPVSAAGPVAARHGRMAGDTTIRWRGVTGIRLATPPGGRLSERDITLELRGGTYADVHLVPMPQPIGCADYRMTYCASGAIRHFRELVEFGADQRPGRANTVLLWDPPELFAPWLDVYLFTDGEATLRVRGTGYRGRTSYVATGRVRGQLLALPAGCAAGAACGTGAVNGGGRSFRAGKHAFAMVLAYDAQPWGTAPLPRSVRPCLYPNDFDRAASPRAADHPFGCDPVDQGAPEYSVSGYTWGTRAGIGVILWYVERDVSGPRYAGFAAASAAVEKRRRGGWVVWFDYGIR